MAGAWQQQPVDLISVFQAAQQANYQDKMAAVQEAQERREVAQWKQQQEAAQAKAEWEAKVREATKEAYDTGTPGSIAALGGMDPEKAQQVLVGREKLQAQAVSTQDATDKWIDELASRAISRAPDGNAVVNEDMWNQMMKQGFQLAGSGAVDRGRFMELAEAGPDPQAIGLAQVNARMGMASRVVPGKDEAAIDLAAQRGDVALSDTGMAIRMDPAGYAKQRALEEQEKLKRAGAGAAKQTVQVGMPGVASNTAAAKTAQLEELRMLNKVATRGSAVLKIARPDLFGVGGKAKDIWLTVKDAVASGSLAPTEEQWKRDKKALISQGTMMLYDFIVAMSGKAVTDRERAMILKAIGDPDSLSRMDYVATVEAVITAADEARRGLRNDLMAGGLDIISDPEARRQIDAEMKAIADEAVKTGDVERARSRIADLKEFVDVVAPGLVAGTKFSMPAGGIKNTANQKRVMELRAKATSSGLTDDEIKELHEKAGVQ